VLCVTECVVDDVSRATQNAAGEASVWVGSVTTVVTEPTQIAKLHAARPDRRLAPPEQVRPSYRRTL